MLHNSSYYGNQMKVTNHEFEDIPEIHYALNKMKDNKAPRKSEAVKLARPVLLHRNKIDII